MSCSLGENLCWSRATDFFTDGRFGFFTRGPWNLKTTFKNRAAIARTATEADFALIAALRKDGRAIGRVFAQQMKLSEATISRRIAALHESALVRVHGYLDFHAAGCHAASLIRFSVPGSLVATAQALAKRQSFYRVSTLAGQSEIIALVATSDGAAMLKEIDSVIEEHPGMLVENASSVLKIIPPSEARTPSQSTALLHEDELTPRQRQVQGRFIRALQDDFRSTLTVLAARSKISPPSAAALLERITTHGLMSSIVIIDPHFIARPLCAKIKVAVADNIQAAANTIAASFDHDWIFVCLQREQIVIETAVQDEENLLRLVRSIKKIPSVLTVTSVPYSAVYKQNFDWAYT